MEFHDHVTKQRLLNDGFVDLYATANDSFKLANYIWNKNLIPFETIKQNFSDELGKHVKLHQKDEKIAMELLKQGDDMFFKQDYHFAIELYTKAIRKIPHKLQVDMATLYAKRANCFYLIKSSQQAEYDYRYASHLKPSIGQLCLDNVLAYLTQKRQQSLSQSDYLEYGRIIEMVQNLKNRHSNIEQEFNEFNQSRSYQRKIRFNPKMMNLWFDNTTKGKKHPTGAHFPCAKNNLPSGTTVLEESPYVCLRRELHTYCTSCSKPLEHLFWPCDSCDEVVFCTLRCYQNAKHHSFVCGFAGFLRNCLSPVGTILLTTYLKSTSKPEFSFKHDLLARPSLSTDADVHLGEQLNKSKLPKRSYQHRYYSLGSTNLGPTSNPNLDLIPAEMLLTLRESIDNKDYVLPQVDKSELISIICEAVQIYYALECAYKRHLFAEKVTLDSNQMKTRLLAIVEDFKRVYRLNTGQGYTSFDKQGERVWFALPVLGTFFWPSCQPNLEVTFNPELNTLVYRTTKQVDKFEKLTVPFPTGFQPTNCHCISCNLTK